VASAVVSDRRFIARGVERTSASRFALLLAPWALLLAFGLYAAALCLRYGLNQTNMDNRFPFGLWIFLDLAIIALGAGAFFTGFLVYILKLKELKPVLNTAVVVGFICYSGAVGILGIDVGQPLRSWFTFWHPNTHSMLTDDYWQMASLHKMLESELRHYDRSDKSRVMLEGPNVALVADIAIPIGMAFHELASNSSKYGALSRPHGRLEVRWSVTNSEDERILILDWVETGGPKVEQPRRRGFGTTLLEKVVAVQCQAKVELNYHPDGLRFAMALPLLEKRLVPAY